MTYKIGGLYMTEVEDLHPALITGMARDLHEWAPRPQEVLEFLYPPVRPRNDVRLYELSWRDVLIGNANHRLVALYLAKVELPDVVRPTTCDEELRAALLLGAQKFRDAYGVRTVSQFARKGLKEGWLSSPFPRDRRGR